MIVIVLFSLFNVCVDCDLWCDDVWSVCCVCVCSVCLCASVRLCGSFATCCDHVCIMCVFVLCLCVR